ncbi:hypothetical protein GH714_043413 [Hevea brasiliensis]|uniref:Exocyst subunit Exo70 family protein n=1 Tax=Hevea brasiliensis TaxID=3981 RepID=A0A6A6K2S4_HEVBR|nr:hypothetical protein GH714_043413 [Hevea brasiliensis]
MSLASFCNAIHILCLIQTNGSNPANGFAGHEPDHAEEKNLVEASPITELSLSQVLEDVDRFLERLSETKDKSNPPAVPNSVELFLKMAQEKIAYYDSNRFGHSKEEDLSFFECLIRISRLTSFSEFNSNPIMAVPLNRSSNVLHLSMSLLDGEFRTILESRIRNHNQNNTSDSKTPYASKQPSFGSHHQHNSDRGGVQPEAETTIGEEFPAYSKESICNMNKIATAMISLGYERECCMAYNMIRKTAFNSELDKLGFTNTSIEDVQRMQWETLEGEISAWIDVLKHCYSVLLPGELKLCNFVFSEYPSVSQRLFNDLASSITVMFLNFAEAVAMTKQSAEKLFKFLDMYETLRDMIPTIDNTTHSRDLKGETFTAKRLLGEAAVSIFCDLEDSIRRDHSRTPVPSGAVHP